MKPIRAHKVVPAIVMTAASAVPIVTTAEILTHTSGVGANGLSAAQPVATTTTPSPLPRSTSTTAEAKPNPTSTATTTPTKSYVGSAVSDQFGTVQATITVSGRKIKNVVISAPRNDPHSAAINSQAVPLLQSETLQVQSANVNAISGATETSDAYIQSLQSALQQAGL